MKTELYRGKPYGKYSDGKWLYGSLVITTRNKQPFYWIIAGSRSLGGWLVLEKKGTVIPGTVGRFTNLLDNSLSKIFDGDIVWWWRGKVGDAAWMAQGVITVDVDDPRCIEILREADELEIVGNVYDDSGDREDILRIDY